MSRGKEREIMESSNGVVDGGGLSIMNASRSHPRRTSLCVHKVSLSSLSSFALLVSLV